MKKLALMGLVLAMCAPSFARAEEEKSGEQGAEAEDDLGFMERYFPWGLSDDVTEEVDEVMVPTILINLLPA
ncbi:MAG: hypothetical protein JXR83_00225, partial [Deltaproteobacteria bacterium]|nr:hypothetical protein [Deltaproteobacteria bacterium]